MNTPEINLTLRNTKLAPLTYEEVDANFVRLREAILAMAEYSGRRLIVGEEPPVGERSDAIWIPPDFRAIFVWSVAGSKWVPIRDTPLFATSLQSANAYSVTLAGDWTALEELAGRIITFRTPGANTGAATLKVNAFAAVPLKKRGGVDLAAGELGAGAIHVALYDSGVFEVLNPVVTFEPPVVSKTFTVNSLVVETQEVPHTLGVVPKFVQAWFVCTDAGGNAGYAKDDRLMVEAVSADYNSDSEEGPYLCISATDEKFFLVVPAITNLIYTTHKTTGADQTTFTPSKWTITINAIA